MRWNQQSVHKPIERILALDLDVLMTINPAHFFHNVMHAVSASSSPTGGANTKYDYVAITLGAVNLFTNRGLAAYADYIFQFYFNHTDDKIRQVHASYGKFFTDMMMSKEFFVRDTTTRNHCFDYTSNASAQGYKNWRLVEANSCLLQRLGCIPMSNYRGMKNEPRFYLGAQAMPVHTCADGSSSSSDGKRPRLSLRNKDETLPFCLVHFQGREHKELLYLYARAVELSLLGCSGGTRATLKEGNSTSVIALHSPARGRAVYALASDNRASKMVLEQYLSHSNKSQPGGPRTSILSPWSFSIFLEPRPLLSAPTPALQRIL